MNPFAKLTAIAAGIVAIGGAVTAWDKYDLPRPIMKGEFKRVQDTLNDTRIIVLRQQIKEAQDRLDGILITTTKLQSIGEPVPPEFEGIVDDLNRDIAVWQIEVNGRLIEP